MGLAFPELFSYSITQTLGLVPMRKEEACTGASFQV
jgi:hypothetical protein